MARSAAGDDPPATRRGIWGWMLFDWAAQPFFTVVSTFIFGPYFVSRLSADPVAAQAAWSNMATIAAIAVALLSPVLGSIADQSGRRKPWIAGFAVLKIASLSMLWLAVPGSGLFWPAVFMICATIAAEFSVVFNDSMMPRLVGEQDLGRVSNLAWGLGYLGGMVVLIWVVLFVAANPQTGLTILGRAPLFGLDPATGADARVTGPLSAIWYFIFILPMFAFTPDAPPGRKLRAAITSGLAELHHTLGELKNRPGVLRFLLARMAYQDGINGLLILGGVFAAAMFGWSTAEIGIYGIILNIVAIFGCIGAGYLDRLVGSKTTVVLGLIFLVAASLGIISTDRSFTLFGLVDFANSEGRGLFSTPAEKAYLAYGVLIGLAFGPVQASSRSFLARSVPPQDSGRYFGLYALSGRATSFVATLGFSVMVTWTGSPRAGMAIMPLLLALGLVLLLATPYPASRRR